MKMDGPMQASFFSTVEWAAIIGMMAWAASAGPAIFRLPPLKLLNSLLRAGLSIKNFEEIQAA